MKYSDLINSRAGTSLTLTFALLIALILGGSGLVIWQFRIVSYQTERIALVSQQLLAVQQLQEQLFTFHGLLEEIARSKDANRLVAEAQPLLGSLLQQTQRTRNAFTSLPSEIPADSLDAIDVALPSQLDGITTLAKSGDWEAVNLRLANQLKPMEVEISSLVNIINNKVNTELAQAVTIMGNLESRILLVVTTTAIATFLVAAFFGWSIARRIIELRMDERVQERTRIARELHDSLLQNVQGLILKIHAAARRMPAADPTRQNIENTLDYADQVLAEGRERVRGLRSATVPAGELPTAFQQVVEGTSLDRAATFKTLVEGSARELHPMIQEECYSIGREAIINALQHSKGRNIEVEIIYDSREFCLRFRDDGRGIDPEVLEKGGRDGHWGLQGMRERADRMGGHLKVWSRPGSGTEVELTVPAAAAYRSGRRKSMDSSLRVAGG